MIFNDLSLQRMETLWNILSLDRLDAVAGTRRGECNCTSPVASAFTTARRGKRWKCYIRVLYGGPGRTFTHFPSDPILNLGRNQRQTLNDYLNPIRRRRLLWERPETRNPSGTFTQTARFWGTLPLLIHPDLFAHCF